MKVLSGKKSKTENKELAGICQELQNQGAECIILGCTDLPLLKNPRGTKMIDTVDILAESTIRMARNI